MSKTTDINYQCPNCRCKAWKFFAFHSGIATADAIAINPKAEYDDAWGVQCEQCGQDAPDELRGLVRQSLETKKPSCPHCQGNQFEVWTATPRRVDLSSQTTFDGPNSDHTEIFCLRCNRELDEGEAPEVWSACFRVLEK